MILNSKGIANNKKTKALNMCSLHKVSYNSGCKPSRAGGCNPSRAGGILNSLCSRLLIHLLRKVKPGRLISKKALHCCKACYLKLKTFLSFIARGHRPRAARGALFGLYAFYFGILRLVRASDIYNYQNNKINNKNYSRYF